MMSNEDEDVTPHGSMENVNVSSTTTPTTQDRLSLEAMVAKASNVASNLIHLENNGKVAKSPTSNNTMRRSTSLSTKAEKPQLVHSTQSFDREQFLRKSLTLTSKADRANLINTLTERISQRMQQQQQQNVTVIPVNGSGVSGSKQTAAVASPEGEKYGFGAKFKQSSKQYFDMSASYPNNSQVMTLENQKFIDNLSSKLMPDQSDNQKGQQAACKLPTSSTTTHYV